MNKQNITELKNANLSRNEEIKKLLVEVKNEFDKVVNQRDRYKKVIDAVINQCYINLYSIRTEDLVQILKKELSDITPSIEFEKENNEGYYSVAYYKSYNDRGDSWNEIRYILTDKGEIKRFKTAFDAKQFIVDMSDVSRREYGKMYVKDWNTNKLIKPKNVK